MGSTQSFQQAWDSYQAAVRALYAPAALEADVDRGAEEIHSEWLAERGDALLARSEELRGVLVEGMATEDLSQRELAGLKLMAAAAYDLSVAGDLLDLEEAGPTEEAERGARSALLFEQDLRDILNAPLEGGMSPLLDVERSVLPNDPQVARDKLKGVIADLIQDVPDDAATLCQKSVAGLTNLGLGLAKTVASVAVQEILSKLPETASGAMRRAGELIVEAINKLRSAVGEEQEEEARKKVVTWFEDIEDDRDAVTALLDKLYETARISEEVDKLMAKAPAGIPASRYNEATKTLETLLGRYNKMEKTLSGFMRVLSVIQTPLLAASPWGPLAVYATYVGLLSYAVYSGGDYLDWHRVEKIGWLDRVEGLRTTVRQAMQPDKVEEN